MPHQVDAADVQLYCDEFGHRIPLAPEHQPTLIHLALDLTALTPPDEDVLGLLGRTEAEPLEEEVIPLLANFLDPQHPQQPVQWHLWRWHLLRAEASGAEAALASKLLAQEPPGFVLDGANLDVLPDAVLNHVLAFADDAVCLDFVAMHAELLPAAQSHLLAKASSSLVRRLLAQSGESQTRFPAPLPTAALRKLAQLTTEHAAMELLKLLSGVSLPSARIECVEGHALVALLDIEALVRRVWALDVSGVLEHVGVTGVPEALCERLQHGSREELAAWCEGEGAAVALAAHAELLQALVSRTDVFQIEAIAELLEGADELIPACDALPTMFAATALGLVDTEAARPRLLAALAGRSARWDVLERCSTLGVTEILQTAAELERPQGLFLKRVKAYLRLHPEALLARGARAVELLPFAEADVRLAALEGRDDLIDLVEGIPGEHAPMEALRVGCLVAIGTDEALSRAASRCREPEDVLALEIIRPRLLHEALAAKVIDEADLLRVVLRENLGPVVPWDAELASIALRELGTAGALAKARDASPADHYSQRLVDPWELSHRVSQLVLSVPDLDGFNLRRVVEITPDVLGGRDWSHALVEFLALAPAESRDVWVRSLVEDWVDDLRRLKDDERETLVQAALAAAARVPPVFDLVRELAMWAATDQAEVTAPLIERLVQAVLDLVRTRSDSEETDLSVGLLDRDLVDLLPHLVEVTRGRMGEPAPAGWLAILLKARRADLERQLAAALSRTAVSRGDLALPADWSRPELEAALEGSELPPDEARGVLDRVNDESLPQLARAGLQELATRNDEVWGGGVACMAADVAEAAFRGYGRHPQGLARVLHKVLDDPGELPPTWVLGAVFALVKLREPLGGRTPKLLRKLSEDDQLPEGVREIVARQSQAFSRANLHRQRHKRPEVRVRQARESLLEAHRRSVEAP